MDIYVHATDTVKYDYKISNYETGLNKHLYPYLEKIEVDHEETVSTDYKDAGDYRKTKERTKDVKFRWTNPGRTEKLLVKIIGYDDDDDDKKDDTPPKAKTNTSGGDEINTEGITSEILIWTPSPADILTGRPSEQQVTQTTIIPTLYAAITQSEWYIAEPTNRNQMTIDQGEEIAKYTTSPDDRIAVMRCVRKGCITAENAIMVGKKFKGV